MFYKIMFWIFFTVLSLASVAFLYVYLMACMMGMPDCVI